MLKTFLVAAVALVMVLSPFATAAKEVVIHPPIVCNHYDTIIAEASAILNITELVFYGEIVGDGGMHYETWVDAKREAWVSVLVETSTIPDINSPVAGAMIDVTVGCVMGTGGKYTIKLPKAPSDPA